jgi:polyhydroxyalkanoate synthase subunit PhaC
MRLCGAESSAMQQAAADAVFDSIAQSRNELTQGWMRLVAGSAPSAAWLAELNRQAPGASTARASYLQKQTALWKGMLAGERAPQHGADRRFSGAQWRENPYFSYLRASYQLACEHLLALVEAADLEPFAKRRARFALRQWLDAMCPANFAVTNPEVTELAMRTRGESITRGIANLIEDVRKGRISQTDERAFELGRNLAATPGEVVYENELIQLIRYAPATPQVAERPLVMVPPCINKYYVLDLQPHNSLVAYAVSQGHAVFMLSWRNVGPDQGHLTWDDYLEQGVFTAFRVAREITGARKLNALGFCVGGTLLGAALAVMAARGEDSVASATFLATMLDFSDTGEIGLFVDEASVAARESALGRCGVLPGSQLAFVFSSVRANDLVWPYVVSNYLLGEQPPAFDILYWNADRTNLPGPMYAYYLRNTYLENRLRVPGALVNCGAPVDLGAVRVPSFVLATRGDHIVPWKSAYRSLALLGGENTFVLGSSGHIAGVVNPPAPGRRSHWTGTRLAADPEEWLAAATEHKGSWWPLWSRWLAAHAGRKRRATAENGSRAYPPIEPAPGRYVMQRI